MREVDPARCYREAVARFIPKQLQADAIHIKAAAQKFGCHPQDLVGTGAAAPVAVS